MRHRSLILFTPLAVALLAAITPGSIHAQERVRAEVMVRLTAVVPPVVKYIVDESIRGADGAPQVRVVTNDPSIRRQQAVAVRSEFILGGTDTESSSRHAKGAEQAPSATNEGKVVRYTVVAP